MNQIFQIGTFAFRLICPDVITPPPNFMLFCQAEAKPEYTYEIRIGTQFPEPEGELAARRWDLLVYRRLASEGAGRRPDAFRETRLIGVKGMDRFYACYRELSEDQAEIWLDPDVLTKLHIDPLFTSLLALERRLLPGREIVLHCAFMEYQGEAILFSAPSETGKTTQANLWEKHRGSRTVNGDRALLSFADGRLIARGWPVCGTSEVCHNEAVPVRAIVMLSQGKDNQVRRLRGAEAFRLLYSQLTINGWSRESVNRSADLASEVLQTVPLYHLSCTISEEAVSCLETALQESR